MFSSDVRLHGFTTSDWVRLLSVFRPRRVQSEVRDADRPRGGIIAVQQRGRLRKLLHTEVGRLRLDDTKKDWPLSARALALRNHASWAVVFEALALESIMDGFGQKARRGDGLIAQTILLLQLSREEYFKGTVDLWPRRLQGVPIPSSAIVQATIDSICPPGKAMVIGLFEQEQLWTSLALRNGQDGFDLLVGPDELRPEMGLLSGDWRRDYRHLVDVIEHRMGDLSFGLFSETATVRSLLVDPNPGAWAKAAALRDIILAPIPTTLAIALGIDASRAAVSALWTIAQRMESMTVLSGLIAEFNDPAFHPMELLRRLLSRDQ